MDAKGFTFVRELLQRRAFSLAYIYME